jgi:diaminopimelate epimerase
MHLTKHHGLGNDFLVVLDERNDGAIEVTADLARRLCDRHRGVGADGLLHGRRAQPSTTAPDVDIAMTLYNSDGSRADMSGNGIRCFAQAVAAARGLAGGRLRVGTDAGIRLLDLEGGADPSTMQVAVDMGAAKPGPLVDDALVAGLARHATADLGNPHLVVVADDGLPRADALAERGRSAEAHFAEGINVEFIHLLRPDHLELTVWERGAGITEACGTGACAAVWVARRWEMVGDRVRVSMPGGDAEVVLGPDDQVTLIGPTVHIADIHVPDGVKP